MPFKKLLGCMLYRQENKDKFTSSQRKCVRGEIGDYESKPKNDIKCNINIKQLSIIKEATEN